MSHRKTLPVPQWAAKLPSPDARRVNPYSSPADSTTTQLEKSNESLLIEDLDLNDLEASPQSANQSTDEVSFDDLTEPDSSDVFGEQVPTMVAETCVMDDLYILVKVPTNPRRYIPTLNKASQTNIKTYAPSSNTSGSSNRRIFAIQEEEEEHSGQEQRSRIPVRAQSASRIPCWVRERDRPEVFPSQTTILRYSGVHSLPNQRTDQTEDECQEKPCHSHESPTSTQPCHDQIEMHEVNLSSPAFTGQTKVSLDNYGILITPTKTPKTDNLLVFQVDTEQKPGKSTSEGASCFSWFTKCFRRKRRRTGLMHATVYKTYFVKWKKCSDLGECPRCRARASRSPRRNST